MRLGRPGSLTQYYTNGFTLIELLFAAGIILVAIVGVVYALISSQILNESNNNLITAANDAQFVLEQMKGLAYSDIATYSPPAFSNLTGEAVTLTRTVGTRLASITVTVGWNERGRQKNFQLATRIAK